jgi:hypothetical protein
MCRPPRRASCGATGCPIIPTPRRWRAAGPAWGNRPWPCRRLLSGRPCVPSVATPSRNGVRRAASSWCASASSRAEVRRPSRPRRSVPHDVRPAGSSLPGVRWAVRPPERRWRRPTAGPGRFQEAMHGPRALACGASRACHRRKGLGVPRQTLQNTSRGKPGQPVSVRGPSNKSLQLTPGSVQGAPPGQPAGCGGGRGVRAGPGAA